MNFMQMEEAVINAEKQLKNANYLTMKIGRFIIGRLKYCDTYTLKSLKKELTQFNANKGEWKE